MEYQIDTMPPEEVGDGLPHMRWRLRAILAAVAVSLAAWAGVISLIR